MAQIPYRATVLSKSFPFLSGNWGRTVVVPRYENNTNVVYSKEDSKEDGTPHAYYMHNVMPTEQGFQSVGYTTVFAPAADGTVDFISIYLLRDASGQKIYMGVTSAGKLYVNDGSGWIYKQTVVYVGFVTTAFVSGITYIYFGQLGCYRYDFASGTFISVTLTGLDATKINGIVGSVGYLIAWSAPILAVSRSFTTTIGSPVLVGAVTTGIVANQPVSGVGIPVGSTVISINPGVSVTINQNATANGTVSFTFAAMASAIAWSSTIDPTDFVPSLVTGAGGGQVEGARGAITLCVAHTLGFIAYTTNNAVSAIYSNNARYPFVFREILSSGGLSSPELVAYDANSGNHYAYTTSGLQLVSTAATQTLFPELTDFISGKLFEDYDEGTQTFSQNVLTASMQKQVTVISDRYLVISYGMSSLTHALIYDLSQKRWGKVKIPHVNVFEFQLPNVIITEIPKQSLAFLQANGTVKVIDFSAYSSSSSGVLCLGKYQFVRARNLILDEITVENVYNFSTFSITILSALDGKNNTKSTPYLLAQSGLFGQFASRVEAVNHSLVLTGSLQINTLNLLFHLGGVR